MLEKDGVEGKDVYTKNLLLLTISEVASENAQILAFNLKKLAIAWSHKHSRKLIRPAVSLVSPAVSVVSPADHVVIQAVSSIRPAIGVLRPCSSQFS